MKDTWRDLETGREKLALEEARPRWASTARSRDREYAEDIALLKGSKADSTVNQTQYKSEVEQEILAKAKSLLPQEELRFIESLTKIQDSALETVKPATPPNSNGSRINQSYSCSNSGEKQRTENLGIFMTFCNIEKMERMMRSC